MKKFLCTTCLLAVVAMTVFVAASDVPPPTAIESADTAPAPEVDELPGIAPEPTEVVGSCLDGQCIQECIEARDQCQSSCPLCKDCQITYRNCRAECHVPCDY